MAISGALEQLPIVDVIQLMHSTRNSGILHVSGRKGESQLVFKGGYIVSASHLNNSVRIGEILVSRGAVSEEAVTATLAEQKSDGEKRKPLIIMLIEKGLVNEQDAYAGLKALIELTLVEILTWRKGTFVLEASKEVVADEFKYYPQEIAREISVDVQSALLDALRIFDEKIRDGELAVEEPVEEPQEAPPEALQEVNADVLGLSDLDQLEKKIPGVFTSLPDPGAAAAGTADGTGKSLLRRVNEFIAALSTLHTPPEVATAVLQFAAGLFDRALTLVVRPQELIAEKAVGIRAARDHGLTPALNFRIPLDQPSLLRHAVTTGEVYCGPGADGVLVDHLYSRIGVPKEAMVMVLPVRRFGQTVFLTYADFDRREGTPIPVDLLEMLAGEASKALERS